MNRKVCVAPMMDCTDRHERFFLRLISKNTHLYTEMIVDEAISRGDKKKLLEFNINEKPVALQLGGSSPKLLAEASKIGEDFGYDEINLNLGCPSKKVQKNKFGACLMKEPNLVADCLNEMISSTNLPVTVKTRIGYDNVEDYQNIYNFVSLLSKTGVKTFIMHARKAMLGKFTPKQNLNIPPLKYDYVYKLKKDFPDLEIIINGGIKNLQQSSDHLKNVDGVMIGRSAYENPFMLKDIESQFYNIDPVTNSKKEILNQYLEYVNKQLVHGHSLSKMMKHLFGLSRGDKFAKSFRIKVLEIIKNNSLKGHEKELEDLLVY